MRPFVGADDGLVGGVSFFSGVAAEDFSTSFVEDDFGVMLLTDPTNLWAQLVLQIEHNYFDRLAAGMSVRKTARLLLIISSSAAALN